MSIESIEVASAIAAARARQLTADTYYQNGPGDPDAVTRESLRRLGTASVGAAMAEAALAVSANALVVPIDPSSLIATGEAFESYDDALAHFVRVHADGVGLRLGRQRDGSTLVALSATQQGWRDWLAVEGVEAREVNNGEGHVRVDKTYRDLPPYTRVHWSPPRTPARASNVAIGSSAIQAEGERLRADRAGVHEHGYVAWLIGAGWSTARGDSRSCRFASRKLGHGVELLADGAVLPMAAERADRWRLTATGVPQAAEDFPNWLVDALGGKWVKR